MRLALYQPDIPQNTGTILRMAACLAIPVDIIRPAGFDLSDRSLRRALRDYATYVDVTRHDSWEAFQAARMRYEQRDGMVRTRPALHARAWQVPSR